MSSQNSSGAAERNAAESFARVFGRDPACLVTAPGRINLIGEHVDYLDGLVMPAAIDRSIRMAIAPSDEPVVRVWTAFTGGDGIAMVSLGDLHPRDGEECWLNYIVGTLEMMRRDGVGLAGFDCAITADLPSGAGLSSSAALETATAVSVEAITGEKIDPVRRARLCQKAEHEYAGVPCGLMDQLAVGLGQTGHALIIDCRDLAITPAPIPEGVAIVVSDTRVKHALVDGEYRARREDCDAARGILGLESMRDATLVQVEQLREALGDRLFRRARHAATENGRVIRLAAALEASDVESVAELLRQGHESLRDDYEVSCPELDALVDAAYEFGIDRGLLGARMTGGGFGGSTISLVRAAAAEDLKSHLEAGFRNEFGRDPNCFITRASEGAHAVPVE